MPSKTIFDNHEIVFIPAASANTSTTKENWLNNIKSVLDGFIMKTQGGMKMAYSAQVLVFRLAGETIRIHKKFVNMLKNYTIKLRQQHAGKRKPFFQMQYCFDSSSLLLYWSQYRLWLRTFTFLYALQNGNIYPTQLV